jgi:hypothetical protein
MARVVPVPLFSLFTGFELETMVCGSPEIPIHLLKSVATYKVREMAIVYDLDAEQVDSCTGPEALAVN